jgi:hypothetical protein
MIPSKYEWLVYVILAGLAWGTYVPLIFYGGNQLPQANGQPGVGSRLMAILCVGIAYFVIGVVFPLVMFFTGQAAWPQMRGTGLTFSSLAGVAGAAGALCVVFASASAVAAARETGAPPSTYRLYIAPLIFGLAPVINTVVSSVWHPTEEQIFHLELPGWKLWLGIVLVGLGAALVLFSKEEAETKKSAQARHEKAAAVALAQPAPAAQPAPGEKT